MADQEENQVNENELKDLEYYLEHPDELPDNDEMLGELMEQMGKTEEEGDKKPETKTDDKAAEQEPEAKQDDEKPEEKENVLLTKDGKNKIPYSVLEKARTKASELETQLKEANDKLSLMDKVTEANESGDETAIDEAMNELMEEMGDLPLGSVLKNQQDTITKLAEQLQKVQADKAAEVERSQEELQQAAEDEANALIKENETLYKWQEDDGMLWRMAVERDKELSDNPDWDGATLKERFDEVVRSITEEVSIAPVAEAKAEVKPAPVKEVDTTTTKQIQSLSDIPAGNMPPQTVADEVANMSPAALSAKLQSMTQEQQDAFLNSF